MNAAGYRTRAGVIWRDTQLYRILVDTSAKGTYYFNRHREGGLPKTQAPKPESEWGKVECEPIVPESLWNEVNQLIEEQSGGHKTPRQDPCAAIQRLGRVKMPAVPRCMSAPNPPSTSAANAATRFP